MTDLIEQPPLPDLLDYSKAKTRIDGLVSTWGAYKNTAKNNRSERLIELDVEELRQSGEIQPNDTFIPQRVIDSNIIREKSDAMAFLNSSHRLAYFRCVDDPSLDSRQLESEFTKGLTYEGWYKTFDKHFDGAALHGWDCIEVVYDTSKPLNVGFTHLGYDKVFFNPKVADIQDAPLILVEHEVTVNVLEEFVTDFGFDKDQVDCITAKTTDRKKDDHIICIYKVFFKIDKVVHIAWYAKNEECKTWLKSPEPFRCGLITADEWGMPIDIPVTKYPIFLYLYREDEQEAITDHKGRAFYDAPQQEAVTAITSGFVNTCIKASDVYASPKENDGEGTAWLEETPLENGTILPKPMLFYNMPPPDPGILQGLQYLSTINSQQTGKMSAAVSNRKDARKTAKELDLASNEEQKITSTSLANYSDYLRGVFSFAWLIIQAQALTDNIKLCQKAVTATAPVAPGMPPIDMPPTYANDKELLSKVYDVRAAGDVDVVQKAQQLQDFQQDWPVLQNTALAQVFLEDYIRLRYPLNADKYIQVLRAGNPAKSIVQSLLTTLQGSIQPEELKALGQEGQQKLQQVVMTAQQFLASPV